MSVGVEGQASGSLGDGGAHCRLLHPILESPFIVQRFKSPYKLLLWSHQRESIFIEKEAVKLAPQFTGFYSRMCVVHKASRVQHLIIDLSAFNAYIR